MVGDIGRLEFERIAEDRMNGVSYHGLKAVAFSVNSRSNPSKGRRILAIHVQRPAVQAHAYGCASTSRLLLVAEIF